MKTFYIIALILFINFGAKLSFSQVLFDENFNYPAGDSIGAHGWNWNTGTTNTILVTSPGLSYSGYPLSGIGNSCRLRNNGNDAYKGFTADSIGAIYFSFMVKVDSAKSAGDYFAALIPPTSTTLYTARFYAKDSLGGLAFGLSKSTAGAGGIFYTAGNYTLGTTYLVVIKYIFNTGSTTDDVMNVYIFSSGLPASEPGSPTIGPVTGTANEGALGRIALRQGSAANAPSLTIDGLRISKTWSNIVSVRNVNSIAQGFVLSQNFPNPFNPNTNINFSIPKNGFVNLTVYNSIGEEVGNLINENLNSGSYDYNFNGSSLNSGVYFYRLTFSAKDGDVSTETKKLILLK